MTSIVYRFGIGMCALFVITTACNDDDGGTTTPTPTVDKEWTLRISAKNESPAPAGRTDTGTANIKLYSDNSLTYTVTVNNLALADVLNAAHLHTGDAISNGPIVLDFAPVFTGGTATGTITGLRTSLVDSLKATTNEIYFNAHSSQVGSGLVRAQLNTNIELATDLTLSSANEVPPGTSVAVGKAMVRVTSDKNAYIQLTVTGLEANDTLTAAHIHKAGTGVNGPIILGFYASDTDFGTVKKLPISDSLLTSLKTDSIYMNAHSKRKPGGVIRAQIR